MSQTDFREEEILGKAYDAALMRRLLTYLKPYRMLLGLATALLLLSTAALLARPKLIQYVIDDIITPGDKTQLDIWALWFLGLLAFEFIFSYIQLYILEWVGQRAMRNLRQEIFAHVQSMHLGFFDKNPSGRLLTRMTNDVNALNELFTSGTVAVIGNVIQLIGIVIMLLLTSARLTLVLLTILPLIIIATLIFKNKVRGVYRHVRTTLARLNAFSQEHLAGIFEVQIFAQEDKTFDRFDSINQSLRGAHLRSVIYYAIFFPIIEVISALSMALIIWYGGAGLVSGILTIGVLVAFIQYLEMFYRPLRELSEKYNILQAAMASSERIFKLLDSKPEIISPPKPQYPDKVSGRIEVSNVQFAYMTDQPVLKQISFSAQPGQKVALVGATGAGKTTVVSLLLRFYDYQSGSISIDGVRVCDYDPYQLRANIGLVLQDVFLFSGTLRENISLGNNNISESQILKAVKDVDLLPFVESLPQGLDYDAGQRGRRLSVGQRQLVSFARVLAHDPKILILDEATSSVDTETELIIQRALHKLFAGRTSVIVAHRLSTIKEADRILVFHHGRIVETGKHEELLRLRGVYWRLYQLQYRDQEAA